jgi:hypothetical protein
MRGSASRGSTATEVPHRIVIGRFLVVVAILFLVACSSSAPPGASGASSTTSPAASKGLPEPCSLITQAEAENALGKGATQTAVDNQRTGMKECRLKPAAAGAIEVIVMVVHKADMWDAIKKAMLPPSSDAKVVSGLGDDAFVGRAVGYNVRKGDKYIQVFGAVTNNDAANEKATRYLAERASSRL